MMFTYSIFIIVLLAISGLSILCAILMTIKNPYRNIKVAIIGEILLLLCVAFVGFLQFSATQGRIDQYASDTMNYYETIINTNLYDEPVNENNVDRIGMDILFNATETEGFKDYTALQVEVYKGDEQIFTLENDNAYVYIFDDTLDNVTGINLYDYFPQDKMQEFLKYYKENNRTETNIIPYTVKGYHKNKTFVPVEITFMNIEESNQTFSLKNDTTKDVITYHTNAFDHPRVGDTYDPSDIITNMSFFYLHSSKKDTDTIHKIIEDTPDCWNLDKPYVSGGYAYSNTGGYIPSFSGGIYNIGTNGNDTYTIRAIELINIYDATLHNNEFQLMIALIFTFIQCITIFGYALYTIYDPKQKELQATRDTFINAMAHEMKTPNAIILNSTEMIESQLHPEKQEHYLEMIKEESNHLNNLLQQMLIYTRTNDKLQLQEDKIIVKDIVEEVIKHYTFDTIDLHIDISPNEAFYGDKQLLVMVIDNFISNALKHTTNTIKISYVGNTFTVYNSGQNIQDKDKEHLWDPLYKSDTARQDTNASGMGLSICKNILELHTFKYGINNTQDGVEFYFITK